jgi:ceramide glucosyltransferase
MPSIRSLVTILAFAGLGLAAFVWRLQGTPKNSRDLPPVTLLKPLCGAEPGLYEHLRSFCRQDYPLFQIVFGVRDPGDPACAIVQRLAAEFPKVSIELVINPQLHGSNLKISNLINMLPYARYDILLMADSDACVGSDYLAAVTAPLLDRNIGVVTCIYRAVPTTRLWSRLGAMYINEWYVPSVLLAWFFGHQGYVSGQTECLRRDTMQAIGGLQPLANHLADDYRLGELVRGLGLRVVLSPYVVTGVHHEPSFSSLAHHELRWMRTIRVLRPRSFRLLFISFSLPLALLGLLGAAESSLSAAARTLFAATLMARLILHVVHRPRDDRSAISDL